VYQGHGLYTVGQAAEGIGVIHIGVRLYRDQAGQDLEIIFDSV
jgi:hypothetical protein